MQVIRILLVALLASCSFAAMAQVKQQALEAAQLKAVEFYYAEAGESEAENFDAVREKILANPDRYILESTVLAEEDNPAAQKYTVSVRVSLNVANLRNAVKANSAVAKMGRTERSALSFVFVSRQVDSIKAFDDRVYKRTEVSGQANTAVTTKEKTTEGEAVSKSQVSTNASVSREAAAQGKAVTTAETGGSVTKRSSETSWRLIPSANLGQVFSATFSRAGYKVTEGALVEPYTNGRFKVASVEDDYRSGNDLKPATLKGIVDGMRAVNIPYIALGTLDVGMADKDPSTGMARVSVTVNARVLDVTQPIPENLASVGPVQFAGVGPTEDEARGNALKLAANSAARELSSQLTNLGLR
jgi:hypothetical protein